VYSWIVGRLVRFLMGRMNAGDLATLMRAVGDDVHFVFPGESSFAGDYRGKEAVRRWGERFIALRPQFEIHDVTAAGPPWNLRVAFRFSDRIGDHYANEGMEYMRIKWGRLREQRVYLDTEKVAALDARLAAAQRAGVTSSVS
jgi:ketosteroid isomerase-like protein